MKKEVTKEVSVQATSAHRTSKRPRSSVVRQACEIIKVKDKHAKEIDKAKYKYCSKIYVADSSARTDHLARHRKQCEPKHIEGTQGEGGLGDRPKFLLLVILVWDFFLIMLLLLDNYLLKLLF